MNRCKFCGQVFRNVQAIRAHLKGCAVYQGRPAARPRPSRPAPRRPVTGRWPDAADVEEDLQIAIDYVLYHGVHDPARPELPIPDEAKVPIAQAITRELSRMSLDQLARMSVSKLIEIATPIQVRTSRAIQHINHLVEFGERYAHGEIEQEDLSQEDAVELQRTCRDALEKELDAESNQDDARAIVDAILDDLLDQQFGDGSA